MSGGSSADRSAASSVVRTDATANFDFGFGSPRRDHLEVVFPLEHLPDGGALDRARLHEDEADQPRIDLFISGAAGRRQHFVVCPPV